MTAIQDMDELVLALRKLDHRLEELAEVSAFGDALEESDFEGAFEILQECRSFVGY